MNTFIKVLTAAILFFVAPLDLCQINTFPYFYDWTNGAAFDANGQNGGDGQYTTYPGPDFDVPPSFSFDPGVKFVVGPTNVYCPPFRVLQPPNGLDATSLLYFNVDVGDYVWTGGENFSIDVWRSSESTCGTVWIEILYGDDPLAINDSGDSGLWFINPGFDPHIFTSPTTLTVPFSWPYKTSKFFIEIGVAAYYFDEGSTPTVYFDNFRISGGALPIQMASMSANVIRGNDVEVT
jgi:hypothetical protein